MDKAAFISCSDHELSDNLDLLPIARGVDHYHVLRYVIHAGYGVLLCPALAYGLLSDFRWQRCVQASVGYRMDVSEFSTDHKRLLWTGRKVLPQPQSPSSWHGDGARAFLHTWEGEDPPGQFVHHFALWVLRKELQRT